MNDLIALGLIVGAAAIAALVTWVAARLVGQRIAARRPRLARAVCALVAPATVLALGVVRFSIEAAAHPQSDWPAMGMTGTIMFALIMLAASHITAKLALPARQGRPGEGNPRA